MEQLFFSPGPTIALPTLTVGSSTMDRRGLLCLSKAMLAVIGGKGYCKHNGKVYNGENIMRLGKPVRDFA